MVQPCDCGVGSCVALGMIGWLPSLVVVDHFLFSLASLSGHGGWLCTQSAGFFQISIG